MDREVILSRQMLATIVILAVRPGTGPPLRRWSVAAAR